MIAEARTVKIQPVDTETLADLRSIVGGPEEKFGPLGIRQSTFKIAIHDRKGRTSLFERIEVPGGIIPEADTKTHLMQAGCSPVDRLVLPQHLGTGCKLKAHFRCLAV